MNKFAFPMILSGSLLAGSCAEKIDMSQIDCLAQVRDTRDAALSVCDLPPEASTFDAGKLSTPLDVRFYPKNKELGISMARVLIAPGRNVLIVVRKNPAQRHDLPIRRIQIFEGNRLVGEKRYEGMNGAQNDSVSFEEIGRWMDGLFGKHRINVREFMEKLFSSYAQDAGSERMKTWQGAFSEGSYFSDATFDSNGSYRERAGGWKYLHGTGERSWDVVHPRESFRTFYRIPAEMPEWFIDGALPHRVEEKGEFEDGFLTEWSRRLYFSTGPNPYTEIGKFAYTGRMLSANLVNGTIKLPNGRKYRVVEGVVEMPR